MNRWNRRVYAYYFVGACDIREQHDYR